MAASKQTKEQAQEVLIEKKAEEIGKTLTPRDFHNAVVAFGYPQDEWRGAEFICLALHKAGKGDLATLFDTPLGDLTDMLKALATG